MRSDRESKKQTNETFLGMSVSKSDEESIRESLDRFLEDNFNSFYEDLKHALKDGEDGIYYDFGDEGRHYGMHVEFDNDDDVSFEIYGEDFESYLTFYAGKPSGGLLSVYVELDDTKMIFEMLEALNDL